MRKYVGWGTVLLVSLMALSCGENSVFIPELNRDNQVSLQTIKNGSILKEADQIPVSLQYARPEEQDRNAPDRMDIVLSSSSGEIIGSRSVTGEAMRRPQLPPVDLPSLEPGMYRIVFRLYREGEETQKVERLFFFAPGEYRLVGVTSYPPSFFPNSSGLLRAQLDVPESADPYLRWSMDGKTLGEGYLSRGANEILFTSPAEEGVYRVRVELFPTGPVSGIQFDFTSSVTQSAEVFVQRRARLGEKDLTPEESYFTLFHFMGNVRDDGVRPALFEKARDDVEVLGDPGLRIMSDLFGYYLDGQSGFALDDVALPFYGGKLSPFSLNVRVYPDGAQDERTIFAAQSADGTLSFRLSTGTGGVPALALSHGSERAVVSASEPMIIPGEPTLMSVSVVPGPTETTVMWFADGLAVSTAVAPVGFGKPGRAEETPEWNEVAGRTVIGGENGFRGVIDEFGVYFRDEEQNPSTDANLFRKAQREEHGAALVYAEGFEGITVPDNLQTNGVVSVAGGSLYLDPGASVLFPAFLFENEDLILEVEVGAIPADVIGSLRFFQAGGDPAADPLFVLRTDGTLAVTGTPRVRIAAAGDHTLYLRFIHDQNGLAVSSGNVKRVLPLAGDVFEGVRMEVRHDAPEPLPLRVHSVLAYRDAGRLTRSLDLQSGTE